ncbi:acyl carrier protein [Bacillus thuringiensis]|uniref:acyl carrier protein n=1 Tax=Bacillus thuringiensis TaxID=1428 RepID=UPI000A35E72E|nr:acyl carrier protein [Bacillus thuringiensis]MBG9751181.1 acyl carrier protein [Bacillus thuringiensis]MBG9780168.1 acyl carrier protein [Bacillus thuringiensis]MBG9926190.1 acyl carrier protein [Bacillus thuringiensis]OTZ84196.1 acyl carrier protein [Bacillus thuringiensis serovar ostriniae]
MDNHEKMRQYIKKNLIIFNAEETIVTNDENIFEKGYVNSLFAMQMLNFIETEFDIVVDNDELDIINFSTINNMVDLINKKKNGNFTV